MSHQQITCAVAAVAGVAVGAWCYFFPNHSKKSKTNSTFHKAQSAAMGTLTTTTVYGLLAFAQDPTRFVPLAMGLGGLGGVVAVQYMDCTHDRTDNNSDNNSDVPDK